MPQRKCAGHTVANLQFIPIEKIAPGHGIPKLTHFDIFWVSPAQRWVGGNGNEIGC